MNWEIVAAIAELLAAIGVIFSLIYLAIQVRSDTHATRANTTQLRAAAARETFLAVASSESLADLVARSGAPNGPVAHLMEEKGFTQREATRLNFFFMNVARSTESNLRMPMTEAEREQTLRQAAAILGGDAAGWWQHAKLFHSDDFVTIIDERLERDSAT